MLAPGNVFVQVLAPVRRRLTEYPVETFIPVVLVTPMLDSESGARENVSELPAASLLNFTRPSESYFLVDSAVGDPVGNWIASSRPLCTPSDRTPRSGR